MNKRKWNMLVSKLDPGNVPAQLFAYADAYLDAAERLCSVLSRSTRKATFERGAVVMFLTAHAVEVFLKGAILLKDPLGQQGHDLDVITRRYTKLFPATRFHFQNPFRREYFGMNAEERAKAKKALGDESERFRYPTSRSFEPRSGVHGFEPTSYLTALSALRKDFARLIDEYSKLVRENV